MRRNMNKGFSTLELLIAFAVLTLSLTAVILVSFGNQSYAVDTTLAQQALYISEEKLEEAGIATKGDFDTVTSDLSAQSYDSTFNTQMKVQSISECAKLVTSETSWTQGLRNLSSRLSSIFTSPDISAALGGDCATTAPEDDWDNPTSYDFSDLIHPGAKATDVDVLEHAPSGYTYALISSTYTNNQNTVWIADVTDPQSPSTVGGLEAPDGEDYAAVDGFVDEGTGNIYMFLASASTTAQFQLVEVNTTDPDNPTLALVKTFDLIDAGPATTIQFYDDTVYIATEDDSGDEFFIIDPNNLANPAPASLLGSAEIGATVNELVVRDEWVYLATDDSDAEIIAIKVSSPGSIPSFSDTIFNAPGSAEATALHVTGQFIYVGREADNTDPDFFILSTSEVQDDTSTTDGVVASIDLRNTTCVYETGSTTSDTDCLGPNTAVEGIVVSGSLAFFVTTQQNAEFQVWNVSNQNNPIPHIGCNAYNFPAKPVSLDYHDGLVYGAIESNLALRIIHDQPGTCNI